MDINFRAYKIIFPDGNFNFEMKKSDGRGSAGFDSIRNMAEIVKDKVENMFLENQGKMVQISIDFKPFHDIECCNDLSDRRCLPLTKKEAEEFWKHFKS